MKPEERPGLGRKIVVTDEGLDPAVVEAIDAAAPAKPKTKLISNCCGAIVDVPDDEPVPEFVLASENR